MSCFFCSSKKHVSHNCDIYKTDEERRKILRLKNCCQSCLNEFDIKANYSICVKCLIFQKCFICFSKEHHTAFCPHRFTMPNIYAPNIDKDLLSRFMQILLTQEKLSLILSFPVITNFIKVEPIKIKYFRRNYTPKVINCDEYDFVVTEQAFFESTFFENRKNNNIYSFSLSFKGPLKEIVFYIRHLEISGPNFLSDELLLLLSSKTLILRCKSIKFHPKLAIAKILKKAPHLEIIDLHLTNVEISNSWPNDLLQYNHAIALKQFTISIPDLNFNVKNLATLMKKKPTYIYLHISQNELVDIKVHANILSEYLTQSNSKFHSHSVLHVFTRNSFGTICTKQYFLKNS